MVPSFGSNKVIYFLTGDRGETPGLCTTLYTTPFTLFCLDLTHIVCLIMMAGVECNPRDLTAPAPIANIQASLANVDQCFLCISHHCFTSSSFSQQIHITHACTYTHSQTPSRLFCLSFVMVMGTCTSHRDAVLCLLF